MDIWWYCKPLVNIKWYCDVNSMECVTANVHGTVMQMLLEIVTGKRERPRAKNNSSI